MVFLGLVTSSGFLGWCWQGVTQLPSWGLEGLGPVRLLACAGAEEEPHGAGW